MADDEMVRVFCPKCATSIMCEKKEEISGISILYDGKCGLCGKSILVENTLFEQDGIIEIIFK